MNIFSRDAPYPPSVYFILGSEFCERFTYYGLRSILVMYLTSWLGVSKNNSTALFHLFSCLAYFSPIIGAIIADGFLGRYKTILYISLVYTVGCIVLSVSALPPPEIYGPLVGLFLISMGTGGIKPCVVTFGGDQFPPNQIRRRATFFSTFYFIINIGSMLSTFITPVLRSDVHCVEDSCYPLAFGVPAVLMTLALIVFFAGHGGYKHVEPTGSLFSKTLKCICPVFIEEVKRMTRLIWLFVPLPLFWALFNQQGSRWTLQASQLDGTIGLLGRLKPDQMQALNPLFIILLIPVFERVIYPCVNSCGIPNRALQRMVAGMVFGALAFVLAAMLQMKIDSSNEEPLRKSESGYTIMNTLDCKLLIHGMPEPFYQGNVAPFGKTDYQRVPSGLKDVIVSCPATGLQGFKKANLTEGNASRIIITSEAGVINIFMLDDKREKSTNGTGYVSFLHLLAWVDVAKIRISSVRGEIEPVVMKLSLQNATFFHVFEPGSYQIAFPIVGNTSAGNASVGGWQDVGKPFEVGSGGVYTVALIDPHPEYDLSDILVEMYVNVKENSLSMMLMIPQYIVITIGEILFSISGLAFAYTQAPESMKSVIQACWLLTTSVGDLIVVLVAEVRLVPDQMTEFFLFAGLMLGDAILFAIMSCFYTYVDPGAEDTKGSKKKRKSSKGSKKKKGDSKKKKKGSGKDKKKGSKGKKKRSGSKGKGKGRSKRRSSKKGSVSEDEGGGDKKKKKGSKKKGSHRGSGKGAKKKKGGGDAEEAGKKKKKRRSSSEDEEDGDRKRRRRSSSRERDDDDDRKKKGRHRSSSREKEDEGDDDDRKKKGTRRSSSREKEDEEDDDDRKKKGTRRSSSREKEDEEDDDDRKKKGTRRSSSREKEDEEDDDDRKKKGTRRSSSREKEDEEDDDDRKKKGTRRSSSREKEDEEDDGDRKKKGTRRSSSREKEDEEDDGNRKKKGTRRSSSREKDDEEDDDDRKKKGTRRSSSREKEEDDDDRKKKGTRRSSSREKEDEEDDGDRKKKGTRRSSSREKEDEEDDGDRKKKGTRRSSSREKDDEEDDDDRKKKGTRRSSSKEKEDEEDDDDRKKKGKRRSSSREKEDEEDDDDRKKKGKRRSSSSAEEEDDDRKKKVRRRSSSGAEEEEDEEDDDDRKKKGKRRSSSSAEEEDDDRKEKGRRRSSSSSEEEDDDRKKKERRRSSSRERQESKRRRSRSSSSRRKKRSE